MMDTAIATKPDTLELQVNTFSLGTLETNAIAIRDAVREKLAGYKAENYSGDDIAKAKADKAELNAAAKKLNDARLEYERAWMKPFEDSFKAIVTETCSLIKTASSAIDQVVKDVEQREKAEKRTQIEVFFASTKCTLFGLDQIFDPAWLNKTVKIKTVQAEIQDRIKKTESDLDILEKMGEPEAKVYYLETLDLNAAVAKANQIKTNRERLAEAEKAKADEEERKRKDAEARAVESKVVEAPVVVEPSLQDELLAAAVEFAVDLTDEPEEELQAEPEPLPEPVTSCRILEFTLRFHGTLEQLRGLKAYMTEHGIEYEKLE